MATSVIVIAGLVTAASALSAAYLYIQLRRMRRADFIRDYAWPPGLLDKLQAKRGFRRKESALVAEGLRQFFLAYLNSGKRYVAMPSQVADDLWHEFILYTRSYDQFCAQAFGGFLHHTPALALSPAARQSNTGLRRVWWQCCKEENINPAKPSRLPLLFALDAKLKIANGFHYTADCAARRVGMAGGAAGHCGGDFSDSSIDGSTSGFGDGAGDSGGSGESGGADSGGDGGSCGGGCGGGD
ncbi:MAG: hypothetical protein KDJ44_20010 [Rhodoblastus sp.]|nr:hypothetical protein [Rhodoblastus sp.]